ncbi:hypothetical protein [Tsukamurella sp. 1534]|uniref:hypothetical protein n=1 Tax=Tsukamurella sp. 1534 TaxID=1151061 RepID=UPI0011D18AD9|nr:hypothetical protein [Tsukamurella sp. 1534]
MDLPPGVARLAPQYRNRIRRAEWPKSAARRPGDTRFHGLADAPELCFESITYDFYKHNDHLHYRTLMIENLIHPQPIPFKPPLIEFAGTPDKKGNPFTWNWQKLHHAFSLPDPKKFPAVPSLSNSDRALLRRYVDTCEALATYSAFSFVATMEFVEYAHDPGVVRFRTDSATRQSLVAAATTFRQVHARKEDGCFLNACTAINKHLGDSPDGKVVGRWQETRARLMNETIQTILHRMVVPSADPDAHRNFGFVNPEKLINTFLYGDFIHQETKYEEAYAEFTRTPEIRDLYLYALQMSMASLAHLYFGFAVLAKRAMHDE